MKKRPFGVSFCVEIVVWCKCGSSGLFALRVYFYIPNGREGFIIKEIKFLEDAMELLDQLCREMIAYDKGDPRRIHHF